jgi:predicted nucleotidyltransferase component of viral defense system
MIPQAYIQEWKNYVPWISPEQVEQDLIISRSLIQLYQDEYLSTHLAFRGGTAMYKLFLDKQPRYSEDIDLVQIKPESIKNTLERITQVLTFYRKI